MSWAAPVAAVALSVLHGVLWAVLRRRWDNPNLVGEARTHLRDYLARFHHGVFLAAAAVLLLVFAVLGAASGAEGWWLLLIASVTLSVSTALMTRLRQQTTGLGAFGLLPGTSRRRIWATRLWTVALVSAIGMQLLVWLVNDPASWQRVSYWVLWAGLMVAAPVGGILWLIANMDDAEAAWRRGRPGA